MKYFNFYSNKGMFLETLINKSIKFYILNGMCWFKKQNQISIISSIDSSRNVKGKLASKNDVDYYGIYKGKFICFEVKQTLNNVFKLNNIKTHQWEYLKLINDYNGFSFIIIGFLSFKKIYCVKYDNLELIKSINIKTIDISILNKYGILIDIKLPGILDILSFLKLYII